MKRNSNLYALSLLLPFAAVLVVSIPPLLPCIIVLIPIVIWRRRVNRHRAIEARRTELRRYYP